MATISLIIGAMGAGKTSALIREINRYRHIGKSVMVINHASDVRFGRDAIITHDREKIDCIMSNELTTLMKSACYASSDVICIEEVQFFEVPDVLNFCKKAADIDSKQIIIAGLQGDRHRRPWPVISALVPISDHIVHLTGLCNRCRDGTSGSFTKRTAPETSDDKLIGDLHDYTCLCRAHYIENM